jgi:hypothetical protein
MFTLSIIDQRGNLTMKGKTIQIYFKGFVDKVFHFKPSDLRRIMIKGIIEYMKNPDEFEQMVTSSKSFDISHYDKVKNIVTFVDGSTKHAVITPFVTSDLSYDVDHVFCFMTTRERVLNSNGKLVPVKYVMPVEQSIFNELFRDNEKEMFPVGFLDSVRKLYKNVATREPLEINDITNVEKYIGEKELSATMVRELIEKPIFRNDDDIDNTKRQIKEIHQMLEMLTSGQRKIQGNETNVIPLLQ